MYICTITTNTTTNIQIKTASISLINTKDQCLAVINVKALLLMIYATVSTNFAMCSFQIHWSFVDHFLVLFTVRHLSSPNTIFGSLLLRAPNKIKHERPLFI